MKTWEELNNSLKCLPTMASINRFITGKHSRADLEYLGYVITGDHMGEYRLLIDRKTKKITVNHGYNQESGVYYTASTFYIPDAFLGIDS